MEQIRPVGLLPGDCQTRLLSDELPLLGILPAAVCRRPRTPVRLLPPDNRQRCGYGQTLTVLYQCRAGKPESECPLSGAPVMARRQEPGYRYRPVNGPGYPADQLFAERRLPAYQEYHAGIYSAIRMDPEGASEPGTRIRQRR